MNLLPFLLVGVLAGAGGATGDNTQANNQKVTERCTTICGFAGGIKEVWDEVASKANNGETNLCEAFLSDKPFWAELCKGFDAGVKKTTGKNVFGHIADNVNPLFDLMGDDCMELCSDVLNAVNDL